MSLFAQSLEFICNENYWNKFEYLKFDLSHKFSVFFFCCIKTSIIVGCNYFFLWKLPWKTYSHKHVHFVGLSQWMIVGPKQTHWYAEYSFSYHFQLSKNDILWKNSLSKLNMFQCSWTFTCISSLTLSRYTAKDSFQRKRYFWVEI